MPDPTHTLSKTEQALLADLPHPVKRGIDIMLHNGASPDEVTAVVTALANAMADPQTHASNVARGAAIYLRCRGEGLQPLEAPGRKEHKAHTPHKA
jgi:hypothetical protein